MMDINIDSPLFEHIKVDENLVPYLKLRGWQETDSGPRWFSLQNNELEIILPRNPRARDLKMYIENAVNLLSALSDENAQDVVRRIIYYDSDILFSRNLQTGDYNSITLRMASQQVHELKQLVNYSTFSEHQPKPYYLQSQSAASRQMTEHYRFGHTFAGSFGFTVLSPIINLPLPYNQLRLFPEEAPPAPITPIERRVLERIVRGLSITGQAVKNRDAQLLLREYASGFNGNMCQSIVKMSQDKRMPIEYKVFWSPRFAPADDIDEPQPFELSEPSYEFLEYAGNELKKLKPEYVSIKGRIIGLSSKDNPLGTSAHRSVIIRGRYQEDMRPIDILVELSKDDYIRASQAHIEWAIIEVNGVLSRSGYGWRLSDATDFMIS
jgi:hypothetical protein